MAMTVSQAVDQRISTRQFTAQEVPRQVVASLLERAARAPSGGNTQPWHAYVVAGERREALTQAVFAEMEQGNLGDAPEFRIYPPSKASDAYMARRRKLGYDMYELLGIKRDDQAGRMNAMRNNFTFFGAPVGIIVTVDRIGDRNAWGHVGMFLQTLTLLAEEAGLATCLQEAWSTYHKCVSKELEIPDDQVVWCGVALGYKDPSAPVNSLRTERVPLADFARFSWGKL